MIPADTYLFKISVTVDVLSLVSVLQFVCLNVLPQSIDDHWSCLSVYPKEPRQPGIQLELCRLSKYRISNNVTRSKVRGTSLRDLNNACTATLIFGVFT